MSHPAPPQIVAAYEQLSSALQTVEKRSVDLLTESWADIEKAVVKVLGGPFQLQRQEHQVVAVGLSAALGQRLIQEHGAFWFFDRDAPTGASLGFPAALVMLSPFGAVLDALNAAQLERLESLITDIRRSLAQAKFSPTAQQPPRLTPDDYQRLFDPGFLQFVMIDTTKAKAAWDSPPEKLARDLRDALGRSTRIPKEVRPQVEGQLVGALERLDRGKPVIEQVARFPRVGELMAHLFGTVDGTGFAPEELWAELVLPMAFIGAPASFPPLEEEDLEAFRQGADVLALFADIVPFQIKAVDDGLLGVFPVDQIGLPHANFEGAGNARLIKVGKSALQPVLAGFDPVKSKEALAKFTALLEEKSGMKRAEQSPLLEAGLQLLGDLKRVVSDPKHANHELFLRRSTEGEAASEQALVLVRDALTAPRIILA